MINSIQIIGSKGSGGAERFCARIINSLAGKSNVTAINPPNSAVSKLINPTITQLHLPMLSNLDFYTRFRIRHIALKNSPAIIQTYMGRSTRLTHIPQGKGLVHIARLGAYYNLKSYRHAHHLIGISRGICDYMLKGGFPADRVHYIGNFVEPIKSPPEEELNSLRDELDIDKDAFVIAIAARFHEVKGLPDLLNAFAIVLKNAPDARLIMVGDGPIANELRARIQSLKIEHAVILPGWCDPTPYYHLADVITNTSRSEGLGNSNLEAWACAKPLVATATQGASELIAHGKNGLIAPLRNPGALAQAFTELMNDPELRSSLASAGAHAINTRFSKEVITNEYLDLYEELLAKAQ
jgi:glycosyltransferase involved in cell wall biosynthesis